MAEASTIQRDHVDNFNPKENEEAKYKSPIAKLIRKSRLGKEVHHKSKRRRKPIETVHGLPKINGRESDEQENAEKTVESHRHQVENRNLEMKSEGNISTKVGVLKRNPNLWTSKSSSAATASIKAQRPVIDTLNPAYWDHRQKVSEIFSQISGDSDNIDSDNDDEEQEDERFHSIHSFHGKCGLDKKPSDNILPKLESNVDKETNAEIGALSNLSITTQTSRSTVEDAGPDFVIEEDGKVIKMKSSTSSSRHQILTNTIYEHAKSDFLTKLSPKISKLSQSSYEDLLTDYLGTSPIIKEIVWGQSDECVLEAKLPQKDSHNSLVAQMTSHHLQEEVKSKVKDSKSGKLAELFKKISVTRTLRSPSLKKVKADFFKTQDVDEGKLREEEKVEDVVSGLLSIPENVPSPSLRKKSHESKSLRDEEKTLEDPEGGIKTEQANASAKEKRGNKFSRFFRRVGKRMRRKKK